MQRWAIDEAADAATRFLEAVEAFKEREKEDDYFRRYVGITGFKETAAIRRASMDLTRALATVRKP